MRGAAVARLLYISVCADGRRFEPCRIQILFWSMASNFCGVLCNVIFVAAVNGVHVKNNGVYQRYRDGCAVVPRQY